MCLGLLRQVGQIGRSSGESVSFALSLRSAQWPSDRDSRL